MDRALRWRSILASVVFAAACGGDSDPGPVDAGGGADAIEEPDAAQQPDADVPTPDADTTDAENPDAGPTGRLTRPSKSGTIVLSTDEQLVVMVNPDTDSISVFRTSDNTRVGNPIDVGDEPSAVIMHPDNSTVFVASRGDSRVYKIVDVAGTPSIVDFTDVGSEPTGLALAPNGSRLFVAEWAQGRVSMIDTSTMNVLDDVAVRNPRALAVTNDLDDTDTDETLVVPEFFGVKGPGAEATDTQRTGRVQLFSTNDLSSTGTVDLAPRAVTNQTGFAFATMTSANQLFSVTIQGTKAYVTSIAASPGSAPKFDSNVYPVVWVINLDSETEDTTATGTANFSELVATQVTTGTPIFLGDLVDMDFKGGANVAYLVSRAGDTVQRVTYATGGPTLGGGAVRQMDLTSGCKVPTGIAVAPTSARAYVNCWNNRKLGVIDLSNFSLLTSVVSDTIDSAEQDTLDGAKFFFTGRGRWSEGGRAWSSCGSCHPDGLTDNITWKFAAGPRQSTSLDGSFAKGTIEPGKQRVFNWTGIFDEIHDFERNTRDVSGGLGAMTNAKTGQACGSITTEDPATIVADGLGNIIKGVGTCPSVTDFDDMELFIRTIRPPNGLKEDTVGDIAAGAVLFGDGATGAHCVKCHGGAGWTASKRFWTPSDANNAALKAAAFAAPITFWNPLWTFYDDADTAGDAFKIQGQPKEAEVVGNNTANLAPNQVACVIRVAKSDLADTGVGTFGSDALEIKANGTRAQGRGGYNIPSLYGLSTGSPYLHHGGAETLEELLSPDPGSPWKSHLLAGNESFLIGPDVGQQAIMIRQLIAFIRSIDGGTDEQALPNGHDACN
jgi:YVTN family beta-propeller protein